jgi:hypothetical protein
MFTIMIDNKPTIKTDLGIQLRLTIPMKYVEAVRFPLRMLKKGERCKRNELN